MKSAAPVIRSRRMSTERIAVEQLRLSLTAGSSRVFDCGARQKIVEAAGGGQSTHFFRFPEFNSLIFMKETVLDEELAEQIGSGVGTKLYFAYNKDNTFEGGRSIFLSDPDLKNALSFQTGFSKIAKTEDGKIDLAIMDTIDRLPSLDPFLLKDGLARDGIEPHPGYFDISPEEFSKVREAVSGRFRVIIEFAFGSSGSKKSVGLLNTLMEKLWYGDDMVALRPIIQALNLTEADAPKIFEGWKGIIYYDYLFEKQQDRWKEYAAWLAKDAYPSDYVNMEMVENVQERVGFLRASVKKHWVTVNTILTEYRTAHDTLFKHKQSAAPFIEFLHDAPAKFYVLGDSISRLDHCIQVWKGMSRGKTWTPRLKSAQLDSLLSISEQVLN